MNYSSWRFVDEQQDLDSLRDDFCWDEGELVEFYGCLTSEEYFPQDISRSGRTNINVHLLVQLFIHKDSDPNFLELVLIECDLLDLTYMQSLRFSGRVDSLKRVSVDNETGGTDMRCARLIYRTIHDHEQLEIRPREWVYFKATPCWRIHFCN